MQMAMGLTTQKPTQRRRRRSKDRISARFAHGESSEGLPGSTLERGMHEEKHQELGRPYRFLTCWKEAAELVQDIRTMSHVRRNPETEVGRNLTTREAPRGRQVQVGSPDRKEGMPMADRESDLLIVL
jgi:hypothetical protein